jgi:hypothetical protein
LGCHLGKTVWWESSCDVELYLWNLNPLIVIMRQYLVMEFACSDLVLGMNFICSSFMVFHYLLPIHLIHSCNHIFTSFKYLMYILLCIHGINC